LNPDPFTPQERDQIRTYLMVPLVFSTPGALLEGVMDGINGLYNTSDAGATQAAIRVVLAKLTALEAQIAVNEQLMLASEVVDEVKIDAARVLAILRYMEGPALISQLAQRCAFNPDANYFAPVRMAQNVTYGGHRNYKHPRNAG
jgi:hypothetical protein